MNFFKTEIVIFIYNNYVNGHSIEEIEFKCRIYGMDMGWNDISSIIDDVNLVI
jgi:hypothetical protein